MFASNCADGANGWPRFDNAASLKTSGWYEYFRQVYGNAPDKDEYFPICIFDLWMIYTNIAVKAGAVSSQPSDSNPQKAGDWYKNNNNWQPWHKPVSWIWHPPPMKGLLSNTWAEVTHKKTGMDGNEGWFMYARGSGVWFWLGETRIYQGHYEACIDMCGPEWDTCKNSDIFNDATAECAKSLQITTYQFVNWWNDGEWSCGHGVWDELPCNIEIVSPWNQGAQYSCLAPSSSTSPLKGCWNAGCECKCIENVPDEAANCDGNLPKSLSFDSEMMIDI